MSDGFFVADLPRAVAVGDSIALTGSEARHAAVVRRIRPGEPITVTDGAGRGIAGRVTLVGPERVECAVDAVLEAPMPRPRITVVQALPKPDRSDLAVDLMTEVGADAIVPWRAARCVARWTDDKADSHRSRWQRVAREASKQARRLSFPVIEEPAGTDDVAGLIASAPLALIMHERSAIPLTAAPLARASDCLIVIGPEGGMTDDEVDRFQRAGAQAYSLGPTVLRTSTAGAVAVACVRAIAGAQAAREPR